MEKLVSIIVPVYNMERYLDRCMESLVNQTYRQIEILLVDDGSKDKSPALCNRWAEKDARVRVIHKENGGLSSARNAGLTAASGSRISFVDSDDFLNLDAIQQMSKCMDESSSSIVCMRSNIMDEHENVLSTSFTCSSRITVVDSSWYIKGICEKRLSESVCDKLFAAELLNERHFEPGRLNEDFLYLSKLLLSGGSVALLDYVGYNYIKHEGSITAERTNFRSLQDAIRNSCELMALARELRPKAEASFAYSALFQTRVMLTVLPYEKIRDKSSEYQACLSVIRENRQHIHSCGLNVYNRVFLSAMLICPGLFRKTIDLVRRKGNKR